MCIFEIEVVMTCLGGPYVQESTVAQGAHHIGIGVGPLAVGQDLQRRRGERLQGPQEGGRPQRPWALGPIGPIAPMSHVFVLLLMWLNIICPPISLCKELSGSFEGPSWTLGPGGSSGCIFEIDGVMILLGGP